MINTLGRRARTGLLALAALLAASCGNLLPIDDEEAALLDGDMVRVAFVVDGGEGAMQSRAVPVADVCSRINVAVFQNGDKVDNTISQTASDKDFGRVQLVLRKGEKFNVVIIAHSGLGSATITKPDEIKFKDNKVTDTFYYYGEITPDEDTQYNVTLHRAVAMVRVQSEDAVPEGVAQMKFLYTGGSSTFDATTGYGCVNSRQTELRPVAKEQWGKTASFDLYTFPHDDDRVVKITTTALDAAGTTLAETKQEQEGIAVGHISVCRAKLFGGAAAGEGQTFSLMIDNADWIIDE